MALQTGLDLYDEHGLIRLCDEILGNRVPGIELLMNDTGRVLRQLDVTHAVSLVARVPGLRSKLTSLTRSWAAGRGKSCIIEGRDIGTTVFPDAPVKFYLTAEPEVRALRRVKQEGGSYEVILKDVLRRDDADMTRQDSPLRPAEDAVLIDTTWLSINQVVEQMLSRCYEGDLAPPQPS